MKNIEKILLEQLGFRNPVEGSTVVSVNNGITMTCFHSGRYGITFNDSSFYEVLRLIYAVSNDDIELTYGGYIILIHLQDNILVADVFDEQEYNNEHKDEPDMAQHGQWPIAEALRWIENQLEEVAKLENIDDLPFPKTVEIELGDLEKIFQSLDHNAIPDEIIERLNKAAEKVGTCLIPF